MLNIIVHYLYISYQNGKFIINKQNILKLMEY